MVQTTYVHLDDPAITASVPNNHENVSCDIIVKVPGCRIFCWAHIFLPLIARHRIPKLPMFKRGSF